MNEFKDMFWILDKDHKPVSVPILEWGKFWQNPDQRRVALTQLPEYRVSTVFLGIDHNFSSEGPPVLFETMVFPNKGKGEGAECYTQRYCTWDEAVAGHAAVVKELT